MNTSSLKIHTYGRFDKAVWRQYETDSMLYLLTSSGRNLFRRNHISRLLSSYIVNLENDSETSNGSREFLGEGANARVFSISEDLVVKESKHNAEPLSFLASTQRMDHLIDAIQKNCPRWIDVPNHYGVAVSRDGYSKQFMLIQKIDHGVTVGDILTSAGDRDTRVEYGLLNPYALERFGRITPEIIEEVRERFKLLKAHVTSALIAEHLNPDEYVPDLENNPYNVVLERLDTPIADSNFRYWLIDQ